MKYIKLFAILCLLVPAGCLTPKPEAFDPCPLPTGYQMEPAIEIAESTLNICPDKLDLVFMALLDVANHSPKPDNAVLIQDMLENLIEGNKVSETYAKDLFKKYFSYRFVSLPDLKAYNLGGEIDTIKKQLKEEMELKKVGLIDCCDDKARYKLAEMEYARVINFIENLVLNEEYLKGGRTY